MAFFFLLSGFVLSMGYGPKIDGETFRFARFIRRRLLKLYPLHLLSLLLFLLLFRPAIDHWLPLNALLLQSWVPDSNYYFSYNAVSWFLSSLLFCYLLFPVAYRHANWRTLTVVMSFYVAVYAIVPYSHINALLYVAPWVRFVDFFLGIMLYKVYRRYAFSHTRTSVFAIIESLLVILLVFALIAYPYADEKLRNAPLYWLVLLPFIYFFTQQKGPVSRCLQCGVLQWLGSLSMPIYMFHPIVFRSMVHFFPSLPYVVMLTLCFLVTVFLSWVIDRLFLAKIQ